MVNEFLQKILSALVPNKVTSGVVTVTHAGTRVQFPSVGECVFVLLSVPTTNAGSVYIGDNQVSATQCYNLFKAQNGDKLQINDLSKLWVDASSDGDKVMYVAFHR